MALSLYIMLWYSLFHCYLSYNTDVMPMHHFTQIPWSTRYRGNSNFALGSFLEFYLNSLFWLIFVPRGCKLSSRGSYYGKSIKQPVSQAVPYFRWENWISEEKWRPGCEFMQMTWILVFLVKCHCFPGAVLRTSLALFPSLLFLSWFYKQFSSLCIHLFIFPLHVHIHT